MKILDGRPVCAFCAAAVLVAAAPLPAAPAAPFDQIAPHDVDGLDQCGFSVLWKNGTKLVLVQNERHYKADKVAMVVWHSDWNYSGGNLPSEFKLDSGDFPIATSDAVSTGNGFMWLNAYSYVKGFAEAPPAVVKIREDGKTLSTVDFTGFDNAWKQFNQCRTRWIASKTK